MFATLPDFTPRDSHSLWYASSRTPILPPGARDVHHSADPGTGTLGPGHARSRGHALERTALARLAADEQYMHRRRLNVQNFGSGWLKPPGVPKTLHQMREEKREQEEHQEALRREQLAQELAEAEAASLPDDGLMDDVQLDGAQDLDDDIPDADDHFALGPAAAADDDGEADEDALREQRQNGLMAARMHMTDDAFREALVRGDPDGDDMYGGDEELDEEGQVHILDEDDLALDGAGAGLGSGNMDANLDITEADVSSSDEGHGADYQDRVGGQGVGFAPRVAPLAPPQSPTVRGRAGASGPRSSMDLSNVLSHDESSFMESIPAQGRRARHG